jgi:hypothetical protein
MFGLVRTFDEFDTFAPWPAFAEVLTQMFPGHPAVRGVLILLHSYGRLARDPDQPNG